MEFLSEVLNVGGLVLLMRLGFAAAGVKLPPLPVPRWSGVRARTDP